VTAGGIVVMKFGGTSVAHPEGRAAIAARVTEALERDVSPVVVVSAMGRDGAPYATDTLLGLIQSMPSDPRERDLLASTGEVVSAVVVAHELRAAGINAVAMTGAEAGICTDGTFENAAITEIHPGAVTQAIQARQVPVIAGFQGVGPDGRVTTLGRGGSDTTACALGVALGADAVEIYTDVDGVMTADPRSCDAARVLERLSAEELSQMARHGSRVVHIAAAELALSSGLCVRVRNTYSDHPGTVVADIASYRPSSGGDRCLAFGGDRPHPCRHPRRGGRRRAHGRTHPCVPRDGRRRRVARHVHTLGDRPAVHRAGGGRTARVFGSGDMRIGLRSP